MLNVAASLHLADHELEAIATHIDRADQARIGGNGKERKEQPHEKQQQNHSRCIWDNVFHEVQVDALGRNGVLSYARSTTWRAMYGTRLKRRMPILKIDMPA